MAEFGKCEVASGRLLKKWAAHFKEVTCLRFADDESLIISGSEDGSVKVWSLLRVLDDSGRLQQEHPYEHRFHGHSLPVTAVVCGYGGCNNHIFFRGLYLQGKKQDSLAKVEREMEKLKADYSRSRQMLKNWRNVYEDLHKLFCVNELIDADQLQNNEAAISD